MGNVRIGLAAQNVGQYRALAKKLRDAGRKDLRSALRKRISGAGKPVVEEVKAAVRDLHVTSHGGGGKRRQQFNALQAGRRAYKRGADVRAAAARAAKRSTSLRETVAKATRQQITAKGVRIIVDSKKLPESQQSLPRHLDSEKGWRHPVFGNRNNWVSQKGGPYFASTIKKRAPEFRQAIVDAMDEITAELEG
jgi:hypothetical protein